ncbi:hypothetical protein ELE36_02610 [Pseudolysobacter antarcticus]|uniref:Uncharacterized protein n=1 Tax=Pseudolysobacter antarcticus TaxID=2511995 RepID=A0A411HFX2_9GAMM|nr:hypothetical protein [Pseudolysobacter antarcticus]QBB69354.1 hypothetical protein ELE36_02610 [Pseudolysobacter antarcticus]
MTTKHPFTLTHPSPTEQGPMNTAPPRRLQYVSDDGTCYVLVDEQYLPPSVVQSLPDMRWAFDIDLMPEVRAKTKDERTYERALVKETRALSKSLLPLVAEHMGAAEFGDVFLILSELTLIGLCFILRTKVQQLAGGAPISLVQQVSPPIPVSDGRRLHARLVAEDAANRRTRHANP